jgi:hypothetical protein
MREKAMHVLAVVCLTFCAIMMAATGILLLGLVLKGVRAVWWSIL